MAVACLGSWGGGMPQWQWPAWGYMPSTPVAGDSLPARGTRLGPPVAGGSLPARPPVAGGSLPPQGTPVAGGSLPPQGTPVAGDSLPPQGTPVAGDSLPARGTSKSAKRPQDAVDADDEEGNPTAASSGEGTQCLHELAWLLERSGRYDNRGYRASIRRQLRRYLTERSTPLPEWLEDKGARFTVMQFRDASFDYIQSIKEEEKKRRQVRVPPVPEETTPNQPDPNAGDSLPGRGKNVEIEQVCNTLENLKESLTCRDTHPLPAVSGTSTPAAADAPMEEASDTEGSNLSFQQDPRQTRSEPPISPRSPTQGPGATPETTLPAGGTEAAVAPENTPIAEISLPAGGTEGIPNAEASLPAGGTEAPAPPVTPESTPPQMDGSWVLENAHPEGDDLSDLDTVQSFEILEEPQM